MFFLPAALIACMLRRRHGLPAIKKILPAMVAGSISAGVFAYFSHQWDAEILKNIFGILLLLTGIRELCYKPRQ